MQRSPPIFHKRRPPSPPPSLPPRFGEVSNLTLHRAPYDRSLQYAMVQLPASGAERALEVGAWDALFPYRAVPCASVVQAQAVRCFRAGFC